MEFLHCLSINCIGKSSGLALLWLSDVNLSIESYSSNHLDCNIPDDNGKWRFTGFYEFPETSRRGFSWDLLRRLHRNLSIHWLSAGNFNELLYAKEKIGGVPKPSSQMDAFDIFLHDCGHLELWKALFTL